MLINDQKASEQIKLHLQTIQDHPNSSLAAWKSIKQIADVIISFKKAGHKERNYMAQQSRNEDK